jgi:hypothetical protein
MGMLDDIMNGFGGRFPMFQYRFGILAGIVSLLPMQVANAASVGLQDVYFFDSFVNPEGIDITSNIIDTALAGSTSTSFNLANGATFRPTSAITGTALDFNTGEIRNNVLVDVGVVSVNGNRLLTAIASTNLEQNSNTPIGTEFLVNLNLTNVPQATLGSGATVDYSFLQTFSIDGESTVNTSETFADRINAGSFLALLNLDSGFESSLNNFTRVENVPITTVEGSTFWRYVGKCGVVVGGTIGGACGGAAVGAVTVPVIGSVPGTVIGGIGGFSGSAGLMAVLNNQPNPPKPVPEPITILGSGVALGFGVFLKLRKHKKAVSSAA